MPGRGLGWAESQEARSPLAILEHLALWALPHLHVTFTSRPSSAGTDLSSGSLVLKTTGQGWCVPLRPGWRSMAQGREGTCLRHWGGGGPGIETRLGGRAPAFPSAWAPDMDPRPRSSLRGRAGGEGVVSESAHVTAREHDPAKNKDRRSADPKSSSRGRWRAGPGGGQFYSNQGVVWPYAGPCSPQKGGARIVQKPEDTQRL